MQRDRILTLLKQHYPSLQTMGVRSLALFGSVARDEARADSDVDLLVELEPPLTFHQYMQIKFYLEDQLGTSVDLVSWNTLRPHLRDTVAREAIRVA